ncbi:TonB-dependent receptor [Myxococcus hansupus]|nr:TonB-dependent receptor [Myxococcus hansupus]
MARRRCCIDLPRLVGAVIAAMVSLGASSPAPIVLEGTVREARLNSPVPGVRVTASAHSLKGELSTVTDAVGQYRLGPVPPGAYVLRFEAEVYKPHVQAQVVPAEESPFRVDVLLHYEQPHFFVRCGIDSDALHHPAPWHFAPDLFERLPSRLPLRWTSGLRAAERLAERVPGALEVPSGFSIRGGSASENGFQLQGLSTRDAISGGNLLPLSIEFASLVTVRSEGAMPSHARSNGGVIESRLKSGCSRFYGSSFAYWAPGVLAGPAGTLPVSGTDFSSTERFRHMGEFGATLGGPVVPNRLTFFAGVTPVFSRTEEQGHWVDQHGVQALVRLNYEVSPPHRLSLSLIGMPSETRGLDDSTSSDSDTAMAMLEYSGAFLDNALLLTLQSGWLRHQSTHRTLAVESGRAQQNVQMKVQAHYLLHAIGTHIFQAGFDTEHIAHVRFLPTGSRAGSTVLGGFVQDRWDVRPWLTINGGVRYDMQSLRAPSQGRTAFVSYQLSPHAGVVVHPIPRYGTTLIAHYAKYHDQVPLGLLDSAQGRLITIDPGLAPASSHEFLLVATHEFFNLGESGLSLQLKAQYARRSSGAALTSMPTLGGEGVLIGNPGAGSLAILPRAVRNHDAVTLSMNTQWGSWLSEFHYTRSKLHGTQTDPLGDESGLPRARPHLLDDDRTHSIQVTSYRIFVLDARRFVRVAMSYSGASGTPQERALTAFPAWSHVLDAHLSVGHRMTNIAGLSIGLDAFNLLNAQPWARGEPRGPAWLESPSSLRPSFPRQVRLGVRYHF